MAVDDERGSWRRQLRAAIRRLGESATAWGEAALRDWRATVAFGLVALGAAFTALAFPTTAAGGLATLVLIAAAGAGIAWIAGTGAVRSAPSWLAAALSYAIVLYCARVLFGETWDESAGWLIRDWGTHHAILRELVDGNAPGWVHGLGTGEPLFDLYPPLPYYLGARLADLFGTDDLPLVLLRMAISVHVLTAVATVRLARRLAPWPIAVVAGLVVLFDRGNGTAGGANAILHWGLLHNAVAQCLWLFALSSLIDCVRRPRLSTSILFWVLAALGIAAHPTGLVTAAACCAALGAAAVCARDVPRRRALVALFHVGLAVALSAAVWMPLAERLLRYGVHYGTIPVATWKLVGEAATNPVPWASFEIAIYVGYVGIAAGLFSRRAGPTIVAALAAVMLIGLSDELYVLLDLGPSEAMARFSPSRMRSIVKPAVIAAAAYAVALVVAQLRGTWRGRARYVAGALAALLVAWLLRGAVPYLDRHVEAMRGDAERELKDADIGELITWAGTRAAEQPPGSYARLLYESTSNFVYHVRAETGLPVASIGAVSNLMLRERMLDASPASLRRFNVRWVVEDGRSPTVGDPDTEIEVGGFKIREVASWDGKFARVERGGGEAVVTHMDRREVAVELRGTDAPALVALGTGYYPRWRARHEDGRRLPVYAYPAKRNSRAHVVAAWLPPGRTRFTPDGPLPSDGKGLPWTLLGGAIAIAIAAVWSIRRARVRALRGAVRALRWLRPRARIPALALVAAFGIALVVAGARASRATAPALEVGSGLIGPAVVEGRPLPDGTWRRCPYSAVRGTYRCADLIDVDDSTAQIVNDAPPSWPFVTPVIRVWSELGETAEYRIRTTALLDGEYWIMARGGAVDVDIAGEPARTIRGQKELDFEPGPPRRVIMTGRVGRRGVDIALVRRSDLEPERDYPLAPGKPPPELAGR